MKKLTFLAVCLVSSLVLCGSSLAQSDAVLTSPTKEQLESTVKGMDLSMGQKFSLRSILQSLRAHGEQVLADGSLSKEQKVEQIVQARKGALEQSAKILSAPQQAQLAGVLLPK